MEEAVMAKQSRCYRSCIFYQLIIMLDLAAPKREAPLNHTKKLGNLEFLSYLKSQPSTIQVTFSIEKYLEKHPSFYLNSLISQLKGLSLQQIKHKLQQQYLYLQEGRSFLQLINNAIEARKRCLNKIRRELTKTAKFLTLFPQQYFFETQQDAAVIDWVEVEGYTVVDVDESVEESIRAISNMFADMSRLRQMTIYLVQQIHSWRVRIEEHLDRCQQHSEIKYYYDNENIYEALLTDSNFIWSSKLCNYIWMEAKQDPFFVRNVVIVQQRPSKTLLQQYFLEILYPKREQLVDQAARCLEMLVYKYIPKLYHRFEEQELLIQNYLQMEMNAHQFDQPETALMLQRSLNPTAVKVSDQPQGKDLGGKQKSRLNIRGWIFQKPLRKPNRDRINDIIESHQQKISKLRPFSIANYAQKNSIALAYLSPVRNQSEKERRSHRKISFFSDSEDRNVASEGELTKQPAVKIDPHEPPTQSKASNIVSESRNFRSLTKLTPVIYEDPKQEFPDTPKQAKEANHHRVYHYESDGGIVYGKGATIQHAKINSFMKDVAEREEAARIQFEEEETPLNLNQFYQVFRADTRKTRAIKPPIVRLSKSTPPEGQNQRELQMKQFLEKIRQQRTERAKSIQFLPYTRKPVRLSLAKIKQRSKQNILQKSVDSYKEYEQVQPDRKLNLSKDSNQLKKMFLGLTAKSIPIDLVQAYVRHLQGTLPEKSKIFSEFDTKSLAQKLSDPFEHSIIFDITAENHASLGTIILSESLGGRAGKLKYRMQFMSIRPFQLVPAAILRVAEELLSATPCQEIVYPFIVDRLDLVSSHFIDIIDSDLMQGVQKFGNLSILQKARPSLKGTDVRQRIYVFNSKHNNEKLHGLKLKMMGNYRSLKFESKCLVLTSNFRLRSENLTKSTLHKYEKVAIGELFARSFMKIMTKYHLKQLKQASYGWQKQVGEFIRKDPFLRSILHASANDLRTLSQELLKTTVFSNMDDLLNYLRYKNHDQFFHFQFLAESRFILHHELTLVELDEEFSLEFTLTSNQQLYILHNHKHLQITGLGSTKFDTPAYLLPTTNDKLQLFIMPAANYLDTTTDRIDLYSYLSFYLRNPHNESFLPDVPSIVIPNLHLQSRRISKVRMYDGFFKLFPEREFYSAAAIACVNHWQSYYAPAVIHEPRDKSIVIQYPFILGFYDRRQRVLLSAFLYEEEGGMSP